MADVVNTRLDRRLADRPLHSIKLGLIMRLANRPAHRVADVLPDRSRDGPLHRVMHFAVHLAIHGTIDGVNLVTNVMLNHISDRRDIPWLHDRLANGPHTRHLLRLVNGFRHVTEDRLTLELILDMPTTLLGHWTNSQRGTTGITRCLCRARGHPQTHSQGHEGNQR